MLEALKNFPNWAYQLTGYITLFSLFALFLMRKFRLLIKEGKEIQGESFGEKTVLEIQSLVKTIFFSSIGAIIFVIFAYVIYFIVALR